MATLSNGPNPGEVQPHFDVLDMMVMLVEFHNQAEALPADNLLRPIYQQMCGELDNRINDMLAGYGFKHPMRARTKLALDLERMLKARRQAHLHLVEMLKPVFAAE